MLLVLATLVFLVLLLAVFPRVCFCELLLLFLVLVVLLWVFSQSLTALASARMFRGTNDASARTLVDCLVELVLLLLLLLLLVVDVVVSSDAYELAMRVEKGSSRATVMMAREPNSMKGQRNK